MPSFATVTNGATVQAQDIDQLVNALNGAAGQGVPIAITGPNDSVNFALAVKNNEVTNSRALQVLRANNAVLIQADANGVVVSPDGVAAVAQVVNLSMAQTLSNKTLTAPSINAPLAGTAFGAWTAWTPTIAQTGNVALTVNNASYITFGKTALVMARCTTTAVGGGSTGISMAALPVSIKDANSRTALGAFVFDHGGTLYSGTVTAASATSIEFLSTGQANFLGAAPAFTIASGDILGVALLFETP